MKQERIYSIAGLSCDYCVAQVKAILAPYADAVEVLLKPPQIRLTDQTASVETLNAVLSGFGDYRIGTEV